ncbi:hypothetical protein CASFOL_002615 [Castilleja foliolosa]|uniref:MADS-box domain-containing protein n=1 Tax=Castilleja foliolosa TaxID=1961234 RepID=A0ABD3EFD6_9LAMI
MARKKIVLSYIVNDINRKASLRKRRRGLVNKVKEISTLCAVDACAVIYSPNNHVPEVWPSPERARALLARYLAVPKIERGDKELNPESFMRKRIKKIREKMVRISKENKQTDLHRFMYRCMAGRDNMNCLDISDWTEMDCVVNQVIWDIRMRMEKFVVIGGGFGQGPSTCDMALMAPPPPVAFVALPPPVVSVAPPPPPPAVVEEDSMNNSLMDMLLSPTDERSTGLDYGIGAVTYPYLFNGWDMWLKNDEI